MDNFIGEERDEFMDYYRQYRPFMDRNQNSRHSAPRSIAGSNGTGSEIGTMSTSSYGSYRDSMALPRHKKLFVKSKSVGRDPRQIDLQNTYARRLDTEESSLSSHLSSNIGYGSELRYPYEDTLSRDSGNSSGGTPEFGRRGIIRHNSYPSPFATVPADINEDRMSYLSDSSKPLDTLSLHSGRLQSSQAYDSMSLRSLDSHIQTWSPLADEFRHRPSTKRKFDSFDEEIENTKVPLPKRPKTPELPPRPEVGFFSNVLRKIMRITMICVVLSVILVTTLLIYELVRTYHCSVNSRLHVNIEDLSKNLNENLYGQHIAQKEVIQAIGNFLGQPSRDHGSKPLLVLILTGWLGSGKTFTSDLISRSFPVQGNVHTVLGSSLATAPLVDIQRIISRSCGYSLLSVDDVDTSGEQGLRKLERLMVSLASDEDSQSNGTLVIVSTNSGGHVINRYMLEEARKGLHMLEKVDGDTLRNLLMNAKSVTLPLYSFLTEYNIPVAVVPYLPLTRDHVRACISSELRENGATLSSQEINSLLDQVQFFSKELPIFAKTGCKRISSKVNLVLGGHPDL